METEIDLRPLITALLRRWRLIVLCIVTAALIAAFLSMLRAQTHTARTDILMLSARSRMAFDDRFVTDDQPLLNTNTRRQSLVALAESTSLENKVRTLLSPETVTGNDRPGSLAAQIQVETTGDLIQIQASGKSEADALALADAWGRTYADAVNDLYGSNIDFIQGLEQQLDASQQEYEQAQQELEAFLGNSQQITLRQQIDTLEGLLRESNLANQTLYTQYMSRTHELELILQDAQTLRQQNTIEQPASLASSLALLSLRTRAVGEVALPVQLQLDNADVLANSTALSVADLDRLISVLEQRRDELIASAQALAQSIASGQGSAATLPTASRSQYEEELAALKQQYEQQIAQENLLKQRRDLAAEALAILQRKLNEQRVVQGTPEIAVRLIDTVIEPPPSRLTSLIIYGAVAAILGMGIGILIAIYLDLIRPRLVTWQTAPTERPMDQTLSGQDVV